ncbi:hypothetical protein DEO72_LG2g3365 [Vigna unguiculata]|uniref:Uncharacterized protein n=1 Tax=Vigna unguiculata TaxID=3917 RepID=A0A4D6L3E7_VIGUN|nr:hypothetical protein DEO72_LG2g3365 [Vigna unguiculata]
MVVKWTLDKVTDRGLLVIKGFTQNMLLQLATQLMNTLLFQQFDQKGHYSPCWFLPQDQSTDLKDILVSDQGSVPTNTTSSGHEKNHM